MTRTVNSILEQAIANFKETGIFREIEAEQKALEELTAHFQKLLSDRKKKTAEVIQLLQKIA